MPKITDEAVPETLVYINEVARCNCHCHGGSGLMDDNCCRFPGWWPKAESLQEAVTKIRGQRCPHCGERVLVTRNHRFRWHTCLCGYVVKIYEKAQAPTQSPRQTGI